MNYLEVIKEYGKLTEAQVMANEFYTMCNDAKYIEYGAATASIFVEKVEMNIIYLLKDIKQNYEEVSVTFYPKDNLIEIWFI